VTFYASKIFWFFVQPISLTVTLLALSLIFQLLAWRRLALVSTFCALVLIGMSSLTTIGGVMMGPLEARFERPSPPPERVDGIIVLGGSFEARVSGARGGYEFNEGADRFVEAAALARTYPQARILVSGGNAHLFDALPGDAELAPLFFERMGVEPARLILEGQSRNTVENVAESMRLAQPRPGEVWLLVTSAFHMPRSVGLFRKAGWDVVPWPADYRAAGRDGLGSCDEFNRCLALTNVALREWIGLIAYWAMGRIDEPFPAP